MVRLVDPADIPESAKKPGAEDGEEEDEPKKKVSRRQPNVRPDNLADPVDRLTSQGSKAKAKPKAKADSSSPSSKKKAPTKEKVAPKKKAPVKKSKKEASSDEEESEGQLTDEGLASESEEEAQFSDASDVGGERVARRHRVATGADARLSCVCRPSRARARARRRE